MLNTENVFLKIKTILMMNSSYQHNIHCYERKNLNKLFFRSRQQILCCDFIKTLWLHIAGKINFVCISVFLQSYLKQLRRKFRKSSQADEYMDDEGRSIDNVVIKIMNGYGRSINPYHKVCYFYYFFLNSLFT